MSTAVFDFDSRTTARPAARPGRAARAGSRTRDEASRARERSSVRLTRRGRLVVLVAALAVAFGGFTLLSDPAVSTGQQHHASNEQVIVEPGQSLWDIAGTIAPDHDPRDVIADIVDLNALESSGAIQAGQALNVPSY